MIPIVDIDPHSGFCFGVTTAINKAEEELSSGKELFCLGDIVHNSAEMRRLAGKGLKTITHEDMHKLQDVRLLFRAHGEPPATYQEARLKNISIVDATCPVVLRLQQRIKKEYNEAVQNHTDVQIVIYGQPGHAEVNGLVGQTEGNAIVIEGPEQLDRIDMSRNISLYSQTTKSLEGFSHLISLIQKSKFPNTTFKYFDTICRQVSNRVNLLKDFARNHDVVLFVTGEKSSNGKVLLGHVRSVNPRTYMVTEPSVINPAWVKDARTIGICGATSTPRWLMEQCKIHVENPEFLQQSQE